MIKTTIIASFLSSVAIASAASAENFDNNEYVMTAKTRNLEFSLSSSDHEVEEVTAGIRVLPGTLGGYNTDVLLSLGYDLAEEDYSVAAKYNISAPEGAKFAPYASVEAKYVNADEAVYVTPTAGVSLALSDSIGAFGEVDYRFNASEDFAKVDGSAELGLNINVSKNVAVRPSVVYEFESEETNARLELVASF